MMWSRLHAPAHTTSMTIVGPPPPHTHIYTRYMRSCAPPQWRCAITRTRIAILTILCLSRLLCVCALYIICVCTSCLACRRPTAASHSHSLLVRTLLFHPISLLPFHTFLFSKLLLFQCMISTSGRGTLKPSYPCIANLFHAEVLLHSSFRHPIIPPLFLCRLISPSTSTTNASLCPRAP